MATEWAFDEVVSRLRSGLASPLPGLPAQSRMAPRPRRGWDPMRLPEGLRPAAALLLIYPGDGGDATIVLTVRSSGLPQHAGQVSLPGGAVDEDETFEDAALREAEEEVGVPVTSVVLLGALTPLHIPVSGFLLHVYVGVAARRPSFVAHAGEVARVAEIALAALVAPGAIETTRWAYEGREYEVPFFAVDGLQVWGATAMVLSEFLAVLGAQVVSA
jgi:8-oxo-dGTP pyrophosphatase MutT (NUDIX family)